MHLTGTLSRYFGLRFMWSALAAFAGVLLLVALIDYIELMRRTADLKDVSALVVAQTSFFRVPQVTERILPFCVMVGAMSCYLNLSRRLELVIARAAGLSAWGFVAPAIAVALAIGVAATAIYNPVAAALGERSKRLEADMFGEKPESQTGTNFWLRQLSSEGQSIINARGSQEQGARLSGVSVFVFDLNGKFLERLEAKHATLETGNWRLVDVKAYPLGSAPVDRALYLLPTNLTPAQVRETFATPETVPFWQLPSFITLAESAGLGAAGYRLQYQKLLARPFFLAAMVMLAAAFSLRFFRMGGVQKMVLSGITSGFALYVFAKITDDMAKAQLLSPMIAAWLPVAIGGLIGFVVLLYQEDG